ncbi:hypothetical protein BJF78_35460 [Pseudonocardia sp. CNS-139]|nr:hypothetical protein BJF78_35460 [Pseudonocardia sp. CNS-139]
MSAPTRPEAGTDGASVGALFGSVTRDLSSLVREELTLAHAELRGEASRTGRAVATFAAAVVAGGFALLFLSAGLWAALTVPLGPAWAGLAVGVLWTLLALVMYRTGRARLRAIRPGRPPAARPE